MTFDALGLITPILKALQDEGYSTPTPIQAQAIPQVLQGRDLLGCAQTGTGKTAAFAIPILQLLQGGPIAGRNPRPIRSLILTPTRELAIQIGESFAAYGRHCPLKAEVIFGGVSQHAQVQALRRGTDILVATPGRLLDLIAQGFIRLDDLEIFVLDEADRMLDMGFIQDVRKVVRLLPAKRQTLFFSATMPEQIGNLAAALLTNPARVEVTPVSSTAEKVEQTVYFVATAQKPALLLHLLEQHQMDRTLVFARTKHGADKIVKGLKRANLAAEAIHGNKSQNARQRALGQFKSGELRVLVATDIAARGIDVDDLGYVINYDLPNIPETYVHRIGRTGRAGAAGKAISFCNGEERVYLRDIQKLICRQIPQVHDHPWPDGGEIVSAPAPRPSRSGSQHRPQRNHPGQGRNNGIAGDTGNSRFARRANGQHRSGQPRRYSTVAGRP